MKILVTGAAGFIGSHLCERLLQDPNHEVIGLDALLETSPTPIATREHNLRHLLLHPRFTFINRNLLHVRWEDILPHIDIVYHLAGMPGVRSSWGEDFKTYISNNIEATQRLLEGCRQFPVSRFIYASTSSVYGEQLNQVNEDAITIPLSPYGVSKLTGEQLCKVYAHNLGVPVVILRFFTVYGPRQRPDMAFHRFITHIMADKPIPIHGDGLQTRDFTYVEDCVDAIAATAYAANIIGETINIGGKERASVLECIAILEELFGKKVERQFLGKATGEPRHTWADISKAQRLLGYHPITDLRTGLQAEMLDLLLPK
ncbi:NAD-dependent epimerase/dehydratase family protein [Paenibacillus roseipurpureus]|uniref:NAD-dependent epimerase/dehydratase family protein n=1 Tax=Paenibacillus roseopurpureus TaxID=2918901 RepID=A0AA96LX39_9BACL|nr:NAD-dependent epimerase/dehydratase family protein [Paenibacillus sp. MBLB1832]WNR46225.1 NAD-dependent epimerase/dehydratase family protein [Paenibacillus sp. MBLB1832]